MGITTQNQNSDAVALVKIELDGLTLRFATKDIITKESDGLFYFWEGRIKSIGNLSAGFNDFRESSAVTSNIVVGMVNGVRDDDDLVTSSGRQISPLDDVIENYFFGSRNATIYLTESAENIEVVKETLFDWTVGAGLNVGPGLAMGPVKTSETFFFDGFCLNDSDIIFKGITGFPDSITTQNEDDVELTVYDQTYNDLVFVSPRVFVEGFESVSGSTTGPSTQSIGKRIPVVYGDFSSDLFVKAYVFKGFPLEEQWTMKVAEDLNLAAGQSALKSLDSIRVGNSVVSEQSSDLSIGEFVLDIDDVAADHEFVSVACQGKTRGTQITSVFGGSSTDLVEHPIEVLYDLIVNHLGVPTDQIDESSFTTQKSNDTTLVCRKWIGSGESVVEEIRSLGFEFGFEISSLFGTFKVTRIEIDPTSQKSLIDDDLSVGSYSTQFDPNKIYFNDFNAKFDLNYFLNSFKRSINYSLEEKVLQHDNRRGLDFDFTWNYKAVFVIDRLGLLIAFAVRPLKVVTMNTFFKTWDLRPGDAIDLSFHVYNARDMIIRSVNKNIQDFQTSITAWVAPGRQIKEIAENADIDPANYDAAKALDYAIYHSDLEITSGFNDTIEFTTDAPYTATVVASNYLDGEAIATAVQTALNAVSTTRTLTVTYDIVVRKFTIATDDAANFSIEWTTEGEIGRTILGFDIASDDTGAATYTSDELAIFDSSDTERVTEYS